MQISRQPSAVSRQPESRQPSAVSLDQELAPIFKYRKSSSWSKQRGRLLIKNLLLLMVSESRKPIATFLLVVLTLYGCGSAVTRVSIPVKVESEIDINRYSNFAVLPFVPEKEMRRNEELPEGIGEEIASILRRGLARQKHFEVVSTQETARMLTGETVDQEWLSDKERLSELGEYFEVKGIIIGSFRFYSDSRPRRYYGERYSIQRQRYVMDYQDYMEKTYLLSLRVMIFDVKTGEMIWDEDYRRSTAEAHTIGSFIFSEAGPQSNTMRELGKRAAIEFTRAISPHYEREDRYLVN